MSDLLVSAHELARHRDCRMPMCAEPAGPAERGPYANLCLKHTAEARSARTEKGRANGGLRGQELRRQELRRQELRRQEGFSAVAVPTARPDAPAALVAAVEAALEPARALEEAVADRSQAREAVRARVDELTRALGAIHASAKSLLGT